MSNYIYKKRTLKELTIKDNFMFAAVMLNPENCSRLLEMILNIPIDRVEVDAEKSIVYHPEYHGIRLDVYVRDTDNTRYSIEMQVRTTPIERRSRYYHSQIDMDLLLAGASYEQLPNVYVIFICDYDPMEDRKYCYTVNSHIQETGKPYDDGSHTIFLSTAGNNAEEVAPGLVRFLNFVHADLPASMRDFGDDYIRQLQDSISQIKSSREMEGRFMVLEEMLRQEHRDGYEEGLEEGMEKGLEKGLEEGLEKGLEKGRMEILRENILDILSELGDIPSDIRSFLDEQNDVDVLKRLFSIARKTGSLEEFENEVR